MLKTLPEISKQIQNKELREVIEKNFSTLVSVWVPAQTAWINNLYQTFYDYEKFMIVMHLMLKTFEFYSKTFVMLDYEEYFCQNEIEIETLNVMEISKSLNIPKETTRRKINELVELGAIKKINKKIIIDRKVWPSIKPEETMIRMSRFLSILSKMALDKGLISESISSKNIMEISKKYFSFVWKLYYEMQMPMLLSYKKVYGDLESLHIHGICLSNHALNSQKNDNSRMSKEFYLEKYFFSDQKYSSGVNAMSISEISGIPRATVIRKLDKLLKEKFLTIDSKKHYSVSGLHKKKLLEIQQITFNNLSILASSIYNLSLIK